MAKSVINFELKEFNTTSLTGTYQNFGTATSGPSVKLQFINNSDVDVYITDGSSEWRVPTGDKIEFQEVSRKNHQTGIRYLLSDTAQLQIKQVSGSGTGFVIAHVGVEV